MKQIVYFILIILLSASCERRSGRKDCSSVEEKHAYDYFVKVAGITDGDTFDGLTQDNIEIRFRIYGIDAPEKKQAFSQKSKKHLSDLIYDKKVGIKVQKKRDGYGRPIVKVYTPDRKDVGAEMLKAGMAWHFKEYDNSQEYANYEHSARKNGTGLWCDKNPVAPWDFRKKK